MFRFRWIQLPSTSVTHYRRPGLVWLQRGMIIIAGGAANNSYHNTVECLQRPYQVGGKASVPQTTVFEWRRLAGMNQARGGFAMEEFRGFVFAVGGKCNGSLLASVECFRPPRLDNADDLGQWTVLRSMTERMEVRSIIPSPPGLPVDSVLAIGALS